ncbi:hypothetical protein [Mucilaginibacter panaciglaebae]|uniref:Uncharacterized protein n=1 Tax=Mucilaginibacter panaciglaebae TaxID=502331 RepID=A0ABP7X454_9SPHI
METPVKNELKQLRLSAFINAAVAVYAVCTFLSALQSHVAWRILLSGTGSVFFIAAAIVAIIKIVKLGKS